MKNKKIIMLALSVFIAAFGAYKAFKDLEDSMNSWESSWDDEDKIMV